MASSYNGLKQFLLLKQFKKDIFQQNYFIEEKKITNIENHHIHSFYLSLLSEQDNHSLF